MNSFLLVMLPRKTKRIKSAMSKIYANADLTRKPLKKF